MTDPTAGRSPAERFLVKHPELAARLANALLGGSPSRWREPMVRRALVRAYRAWTVEDWELNTLLHDPERYQLRIEGMPIVDVGDHYVGIDGYLRFSQTWRADWTTSWIHGVAVRHAGPNLVEARYHVYARSAIGLELSNVVEDTLKFERGRLVEHRSRWTGAGQTAAVIQAHGIG